MGKAFVAVADDPNAMFLNPAGLGTQKRWELTTMSSNFLDEYQYMMFCGVNPTPLGVFGIGYVSSSIGDIATIGGTTSFYNQAMVLSYGKNTGDILPDTYAGATFKYYSKGYTGALDLSASGYNVDLGVLYVPEKWMSYGLNFQNVFPGAQIKGDFEPEEMHLITKIGASFYWMEQNVRFALDKDMFFGRANIPWPMHFGAEWKAHQNLYLRAGYDQVASAADGGDMTNNTTFGLGLEYSGIKVDLAYMQNYAQTSLASNVASISFYSEPFYAQEAPPKKEAPPPPKEEAPQPPAPVVAPPKTVDKKISVIPSSDLYTLDSKQVFIGAIDFDVTDVWIDGRRLEIRSDRIFEKSVPLNIGKNEKTIKVRDTSSAKAEIIRKIIRFYVPTDLALKEAQNKSFEFKAIYTELYRYLGKDYNTNKNLSREMLALIISKAKKLDLSLTQKAVSKDVSYMYWAAKFIKAVKSAGIMNDYSDGTFRPEKLVTRAEIAQIMANAANIDKASILGYLAAKSPEGDASIEDLVELIYLSGMLEKEIDSYRSFIGAEGFMEEAPPEKEALPPQKEVAPAPAPEVVTTLPAVPVPALPHTPEAAKIPVKPVTDKIKIINPQDKTYTFDSEITFNGRVDPDVEKIWINDKKILFRSDGTFSESVPLAYGKNYATVRLRDTAKNEGTISMRFERHYLPKGMTKEEAKSRYIDHVIIQTKLHDYLGKDYSLNDYISREALNNIIKKIKKLPVPLRIYFRSGAEA